MTEAAAQPGNVVDPYRAYNFKLLINNVTSASFCEVTGFGVQIARTDYREAGNNAVVRPIPCQVRYPPVTLRYGVTDSMELWDWLMTAVEGRVSRRPVHILMLDPAGSAEVLRWSLDNAWPEQWYGAPLNSMNGEIAIETLVLAHEGLRRETSRSGASTA
jgi:phage tail-like protein